MTGYKGMPRHSLEIKLQAVRMHLEQQMPCTEVGQQLGIRPVLVAQWCVSYRREGEAAFHKPIGRPRGERTEAETMERLRMENALLKKFRTELRKITLARRDIGSLNTTEEGIR